MQKRIGKEKDDINIPRQQKRPMAKPLSEIAARHRPQYGDTSLLTKQVPTANDDRGYCSKKQGLLILGLILLCSIYLLFIVRDLGSELKALCFTRAAGYTETHRR